MNELVFFVAKDGRDEWSGRLEAPAPDKNDGPFATLARARDVIRQLKAAGGVDRQVKILVRGGKYFMEQTLILGPEDSGTAEFPVIYQAYPGEKPILSGGQVVQGWEPYQGRILKCSLPGAKGGKWKFRQLFYGPQPGELGQRQIRARYPKYDPENPLYGGWAFMEGPADDGTNRAWSFPEGTGWRMSADKEGGVANAFRVKPGFFKGAWAKPSEGEVCMFHGFGMG